MGELNTVGPIVDAPATAPGEQDAAWIINVASAMLRSGVRRFEAYGRVVELSENPPLPLQAVERGGPTLTPEQEAEVEKLRQDDILYHSAGG